jgi:hypothetical protein
VIDVAKKKSPEHLKEDEKRTTSMGLFNQAEAYWLSAMALEEAALRIILYVSATTMRSNFISKRCYDRNTASGR